MAEFGVWAPNARQVEIEIEGRRLPMAGSEHGWWSAHVTTEAAGVDYKFVLDGADALPDPRSPWQPHGIHGPSRTIDHDAFAWTDQQWQAGPLATAVFYELHVGTFTPQGTFCAVVDKLDYLVDIGITHIELMPVAEFSGSRGWGYDGVDLYAPHHIYGEPDDLKRLVNACHARGVAVILDVVYNHLGPAGNYLERFGPYFTSRYDTPWGKAVNFDGPGSDEVRRFICDNALMWLRDYHFDGLRIDAVHALIDNSATHILEQLARETAQLETELGRHLILVAESDLNDPRIVRPQANGGYGLHAQWNDDFHHALHTVLTGERDGYYADFGSLADLRKAIERIFVYDGCYSRFRRRNHGNAPSGLSRQSFLAYLQNHDQIGNRAQGDRSSRLMNIGRLKIAAALVMGGPFVPMLFQGEEWGASSPFPYFTDHEDAELGRLVTEGRRREFADFAAHAEDIPDPQASETFEHAKLIWDERDKEPHVGLLEWHRALIRMRRLIAQLGQRRLDKASAEFDEDGRWFVMRRDPLTVALNLASYRQRVPARIGKDARMLSASNPNTEIVDGTVELAPDSVAVLLDPRKKLEGGQPAELERSLRIGIGTSVRGGRGPSAATTAGARSTYGRPRVERN